MRFGVSTLLFHGDRLERRHLEQVATHGFDLVEVFATRTHFDYHDRRRVASFAAWLRELDLRAWSLHAPICEGFSAGVWGRAYSNAATDKERHHEAVAETLRSIDSASDLGCSLVVLHLGIPRGQPIAGDDNSAAAVARSLEPIASACEAAGVGLALEVIPNDLATPQALLGWLDGRLDLGTTAVCLDVGHAHLMGGAPEAVELLSGHIVTTHVHDNRGATDDHLAPFEGTVDWPATLTAFFKIGYTGPLVFELTDHGDAYQVLRQATTARRRIQTILDDLNQPLEFTER